MLLVGSMYLVHNQTDTLMLGWLRDVDEVGLYAAANRGAGVLGFIMMAAAATFAPLFAAQRVTHDREALQRMVTQACRWTVGLTLPAGIVLVLASQPFLALFGAGFTTAEAALQILAAGHMLAAFFGPVAMLLIMTGHERATGVTIAATAALNIVLNMLLIPAHGIAGAALATSLSALAWNVALYGIAETRLEVRALPWTPLLRRRGEDAA
jgi:O-antigen/teichoic acid export membrane protein